MPTQPVSIYLSGDSLRSRSVSNIVLTGTIDIPAPPPRLVADWAREIAFSRPGMLPGDVEQLPLPRAHALARPQTLHSGRDWLDGRARSERGVGRK